MGGGVAYHMESLLCGGWGSVSLHGEFTLWGVG